jgi:hypothetical protein
MLSVPESLAVSLQPTMVVLSSTPPPQQQVFSHP